MSEPINNGIRERKLRQGMFFMSLSMGATVTVILMLFSLLGYMLVRGSSRLFYSQSVELLHADGSRTQTNLNHNVEFDVLNREGKTEAKSPREASQSYINLLVEAAKLREVPVPQGLAVEHWGEVVELVDDPWAEAGTAAGKVEQKSTKKIADLTGAERVTYDVTTQAYTVTLAGGEVKTIQKPGTVQFRDGKQLKNLNTIAERHLQDNPKLLDERKAAIEAELAKNVPEGFMAVNPEWKAWELAQVERFSDKGQKYEREERITQLGSTVAFRFTESWNWFQFFREFPRSGGTEGGVLPCIYGTVLMTLLMTVVVAPFGVATAVYLREYARDNWFTHLIRLAIANLAGVPSIVFGLFGLGFFVLTIGRGIDDAFYNSNKVFGTPCVLWASLTMALLTLPVMIVAAEEALRTVPRELREGALALGATKFSSIVTVVIPSALPGILTGVILAVARGAGEVAPLLLTGVVAHKDQLPLNPLEKFMNLAYHIYDLALKAQPNKITEAQALAFSSALVLLMVVLMMNLLAIWLRARLSMR